MAEDRETCKGFIIMIRLTETFQLLFAHRLLVSVCLSVSFFLSVPPLSPAPTRWLVFHTDALPRLLKCIMQQAIDQREDEKESKREGGKEGVEVAKR